MNRRGALAALIAWPPPVAIKGYDPVAYFAEGCPVKGVASIAQDFDERRYFFSSAKNRELFAADPERYAPQFQGAFVVHNGKLYLFEASRGVERVEKDPSLIDKAHQRYQKK